MKEFEIWVSEEVTYKYKIRASNKDEAENIAIDNCDEEKEDLLITEPTRDRVEVISSKELKE